MKEIEDMAKTGNLVFKGLGEEDLPEMLDEFALLPKAHLAASAYSAKSTAIIIGEGRNIKHPLVLSHPLFVDTSHLGKMNKSVRIALAYGAFLARCPIAIGYGILPEEEKIAGKFKDSFILQWNPMRLNNDIAALSAAKAIVVNLLPPSHSRMFSLDQFLEILDERGELITSEIFGPGRHLDMEKKTDLAKHLELIREATEYALPVMVKIGASGVFENTKLALSADADAVIIDCSRNPYSTITNMTGSYGTSLIGAIPPAAKAFASEKAGERGIKLIVSGGFRNGQDVIKAIALGADGIALAESAGVAIGCNLCGDCNDFRCERGISTLDEGLKSRFIWKVAGKKLANFISLMKLEVEGLLDYLGVGSIKEVKSEHLVALTYDTAAISGIKLIGYDKELPMWFH